MSRKKTHEEYITEINSINPNISVLEKYITTNTKILHKCKIDGYEWYTTPSSVLSGRGCPKCAGKMKHTPEEYITLVKDVNPNIEVMENYISNNIKIKHRCKICNYQWSSTPNHILCGIGCPVCANPSKTIGPAPEYKNSIWASEYKECFVKYMTEEQMKQYTPHSHKQVAMICPECEKERIISPYQVLHDGFSCICNDGHSYPNKFIFSMLEQLKIDFLTEYTFTWSNKKRYDFYLPAVNCIIENHGAQHYKYTGFQRTLSEEVANDQLKQQMAINNGITHYVVLDCRKSTKDWIWKSICDSELKNILNFDLSDLDLDLCDCFATSSMIKLTIEYWNQGNGIKEISQLMKINRNTVKKYLEIGHKNKWCTYTIKESYNRALERKKNNNINCIQIYCLEQDKVYQSISMAAQELNIHDTNIAKCCKGKNHTAGGYHWYYIYDRITKTGQRFYGAISLGLISEDDVRIKRW